MPGDYFICGRLTFLFGNELGMESGEGMRGIQAQVHLQQQQKRMRQSKTFLVSAPLRLPTWLIPFCSLSIAHCSPSDHFQRTI